jgi:CHAD domain-containing protein
LYPMNEIGLFEEVMSPVASRRDSSLSVRRLQRLLRARSATLLRQIAKVRASSDPAAIHDLRVATRRLQEALDFFEPCVPARARRRLVRRARRIRRALGEIRNADVTLEMVNLLRSEWGPESSRMLHELRDLLRTETAALRRAATGREGVPVAGARKRSRALLAGLDGRRELDLGPRARQVLKLRVGEVLDRLPPARTGGAEALHRLRLAVKHYRYALEILEDLGWRRARPGIAAARKIQEELGRIHDLDVLAELVRRIPSAVDRELLERIARNRRLRLAAFRKALRDFRPDDVRADFASSFSWPDR